MKALRDKKGVLWLFVLIVVLSAVAIYRIGFRIPVPAFNQQVVTSPEQEPARAVPRPYRLEHPLYFRVAFGDKSSDAMLGMVNESGGTGTEYDVAYVDENMNGDLTDDAAKKFSRIEQGSRAGQLDRRFEFTGPLKTGQSARYTLDIYGLPYWSHQDVQRVGSSFIWFLDVNQWNYFFVNGKMTLFSTAADALKNAPVRLGGPCKWDISARTRDGKPMISAKLNGENGCTLRIVRCAGQTISPTLTLIQDGQVKAKEQMKFG